MERSFSRKVMESIPIVRDLLWMIDEHEYNMMMRGDYEFDRSYAFIKEDGYMKKRKADLDNEDSENNL